MSSLCVCRHWAGAHERGAVLGLREVHHRVPLRQGVPWLQPRGGRGRALQRTRHGLPGAGEPTHGSANHRDRCSPEPLTGTMGSTDQPITGTALRLFSEIICCYVSLHVEAG